MLQLMVALRSIDNHNADMHHFDLALLRTFIAVVDRASMTAAGSTLRLTQSAVSQQIARLEEQVGAVLFARDRRGLRLTPAGERLLGKARRLVALNDEVWTDMTPQATKAVIRLGVPQDLLVSCLSPILKDYATVCGKIEVVLMCAPTLDLQDALARGEIDLALLKEPVGPSRGERLAVEQLVWVGAKAGRARWKTPLPVSLVTANCVFRPFVFAALREMNIDWCSVFENGSIEATDATVRADLAVTTRLAPTVPEGLEILPADDQLPELPAFSINLHTSQQPMAATIEFAEHIRDSLRR